MSISRNFFLGRELRKRRGFFGFLDKDKMSDVCKRSLNNVGIKMRSPHEIVSPLSGGEKQAIAIGRALHFGAKLLILDEPTAALSVKESRKVLEFIEQCTKAGLSVIFITHNIHHVYEVADRFTILEHGKKMGDFKKEDVSAEDISEIIARAK